MGGGTGPRGAMGKVLCLDDLQLPAVPSCRPKAGFFGNSLSVTPLSHPALTSAFRPQPTLCLGNDQLHVCMEQEPVCGQHLGPWLLCREWEWGGAAHTGPSHREVLDKNPWSPPPLASSGTLLAWHSGGHDTDSVTLNLQRLTIPQAPGRRCPWVSNLPAPGCMMPPLPGCGPWSSMGVMVHVSCVSCHGLWSSMRTMVHMGCDPPWGPWSMGAVSL